MTAEQPISRTAKIIGVLESLVLIEVDENTSLMKNELGYVCVGNERLKAEVLRVRRRTADMQVFEDTRGVKVGDTVELTGEMLSAVLGPGLLGQVFDGLLNPLHTLADKYGFFLPRGITMPPLDPEKKWHFEPGVAVGARVSPGGAIGTVPEGQFKHKIMVPFNEPEPVEITWIRGGNLQVEDVIARYKTSKGTELEMTMSQRWAVRNRCRKALSAVTMLNAFIPLSQLPQQPVLLILFSPLPKAARAVFPVHLVQEKPSYKVLSPVFRRLILSLSLPVGKEPVKWLKRLPNIPKLLTLAREGL